MKFITNILSINRKPNYIHQSLASLFISGFNKEVNILVGDQDIFYLENYKQNKKIKIKPMSDWEKIKNWSPERKTSYNWIRGIEGPNNYLIIEDDTIFHDDIIKKIEIIKEEIEKKNVKYILTLYHVLKMKSEKSYIECNEVCEAHCVWYPETVILSLRDYINKMSIIDCAKTYTQNRKPRIHDAPGDWLITRFAKEQNIPIFTPTRSLAQHIGHNSTWQNPEFIQSPTF